MMNVQCDQAPEKQQKKFKNSSMEAVAEQSMSSQTPFGSVIEFAKRTENLNMHHIAPSRQHTCSHVSENHSVCD
jgi:hypothetical protein